VVVAGPRPRTPVLPRGTHDYRVHGKQVSGCNSSLVEKRSGYARKAPWNVAGMPSSANRFGCLGMADR
jgi:hypothetical protein